MLSLVIAMQVAQPPPALPPPTPPVVDPGGPGAPMPGGPLVPGAPPPAVPGAPPPGVPGPPGDPSQPPAGPPAPGAIPPAAPPPAAPLPTAPPPTAPPPTAPPPTAPPPAAPAPQQPRPYAQPQPYYPYGRQPYYDPYGRPYPPYRPATPPPGEQLKAPTKPEDDEVTVFFRLGLGVGTRGFSQNESLLTEIGYGGVRMWTTLDGAWMFHENIGAGLWMGLNRRSASPDNGPGLNEVAYFIGGQVPLKLWGTRSFALQLTPRAAFSAGRINLAYEQGSSAGEAEFQNAFMWGGAASALSFKYHVGGSVSFMRAATGPPGGAGRDHDYGGLYFSLEGTIDG